ncbi:MAG: hypothetical protein HFK10_09455 [Clostridia bacterium]|nr:hypothetical protein [Clostridia bacterium]
MTTLKRNILLAGLAIACILSIAFSAIPVCRSATVAYAVNNANAFDDTVLLDDFKDENGNFIADFNYSDYPFKHLDTENKFFVMNFMEYCYSYKTNLQDHYGLYLYVYNPMGYEIATDSNANTVQMAVSWRTEVQDGETVAVADDYEKFDLKYCSKSVYNEEEGALYKFRVIDRISEHDGNSILTRVDKDARRYDISGIELHVKGQANAVESTVGGTFIFTGYMSGYGLSGAESTLDCKVTELETVRLEVKSTVYRDDGSSLGKDHQNQLNSVYFAVDNAVIEKYGDWKNETLGLQKVKAEWWEYKTSPIVVTSDSDMVAALSPYIGKDISTLADYSGGHSDTVGYRFGTNHRVAGLPNSSISYDWAYNVSPVTSVSGVSVYVDDMCSLLPYLFATPDGIDVKDYTVSSSRLTDYMFSYNKSANGGYIQTRSKTLSADLFTDSVDEGRTRGYNCVEIDASDKFNLLSYADSHDFWDKMSDYGLWNSIFKKYPTNSDRKHLSPIYAVTDNDLSLSGDTFAHALLIDKADENRFKEYCETNAQKKKTTFLFRFSATDYYASMLTADINGGAYIRDTSYMAYETVFFDFDILQLTFNKAGKFTVLPVVSHPIDIIGAIRPPLDYGKDGCGKMLSWVFLAIVLVLLLILFGPFLPHILQFIVWLVTLPIKAIAALVRAIGKTTKKKKDGT